MTNKKILIIQNTDFHFEVCTYLYSLFKQIGYDPFIYRCNTVKTMTLNTDQSLFLQKFNFQTIEENIFPQDFLCGIIISAYPNPRVTKRDAIPNSNDRIIKRFINKLIYITHRFKDPIDYVDADIGYNNTLSLSPISKNVNIDYINLIDSIIQPEHRFTSQNIKITIQGHFEYRNRNVGSLINLIKRISRPIQLNILGTQTKTMLVSEVLEMMKNNKIKIKIFDNVSNHKFFDILNKETDFVLALLDPETKYGQYVTQRYSTNFCHCMCLEKPIICHKNFQEIYNIPGIYYDHNYDIDISSISTDEYKNIVSQFKDIKIKLSYHNLTTINKKINEAVVN